MCVSPEVFLLFTLDFPKHYRYVPCSFLNCMNCMNQLELLKSFDRLILHKGF